MATSTPPLSGRTAFITGGARRIGAALVRAFHAAGANIVVHHRHSHEEAGALARELTTSRPDSVILVRGDLLDTARLAELVAEARQAFGQIDVLVNNASSFYPTAIGEITEQAWEDLVGTNLKAPLFLSQAAAPALRAARGLILNLVDIHGMRPLAQYPLYSTAKAALIMLTKALARELAPEVRVNGIAPGPVLWPEDAAPELQQKIIESTLLKRAGSPQDVARAALFFAVDAPYVTGQVLAVDGGRSV
jgi:pteridine reductase